MRDQKQPVSVPFFSAIIAILAILPSIVAASDCGYIFSIQGGKYRANATFISKDGGLIVSGQTMKLNVAANSELIISNPKVSFNPWLLKLNKAGEKEWFRVFERTTEDSFSDIVESDDGGYFAVGTSINSDTKHVDAWMVKLDKRGQIEWEKVSGYIGVDELNSIIALETDEYLAVGHTQVISTDIKSRAWLAIIGNNGDINWEKTFGDGIFYSASLVKSTSDNGLIVVGIYREQFNSHNRVWIMKTTFDGNNIWERTWSYTADYQTTPTSIVELANGDFLITGEARLISDDVRESIYANYVFLQIDNSGGIVSEGLIDDSALGFIAITQPTPSGAIIVAGTSFFKAIDKIWLYSYKNPLKLTWEQSVSIPNATSVNINDIELQDNGDFFVAVSSSFQGENSESYWISLFSPEGECLWHENKGQ